MNKKNLIASVIGTVALATTARAEQGGSAHCLPVQLSIADDPNNVGHLVTSEQVLRAAMGRQ